MRELRDKNGEMPADFQNHINSWSLESVCAVALERRLHVLGGKSKDEKAQELIKAIRMFFEKSFEYDGLPSIWKYYQTPGFKKFLECYDTITKYCEL
jgi:cytochrome P450 family 12